MISTFHAKGSNMITTVIGVIMVVLALLLGLVSNGSLAGTMGMVGFAMIFIGIDLGRIRKELKPPAPPPAMASPPAGVPPQA
jgi:hypothetical protein